MNIAVIGNCTMAATHIRRVCAEKGAKLYALCDADSQTLSQRKEEFGAFLAVSDYRELVNDPNLDAVIILVEDAQDPAMVKAFLDAGKTVLCEKPATCHGKENAHNDENHPAKLLLGTFEECASPKNPVCRSRAYFARALDYIQTNYHRQITVTKLADHLGLTRSYFSRIFQEHAGTTPKEYIVNYRLEKAVELLTENGLSQKEVASLVGYSDVYAFSRMFRRKYGMPPGKYVQER